MGRVWPVLETRAGVLGRFLLGVDGFMQPRPYSSDLLGLELGSEQLRSASLIEGALPVCGESIEANSKIEK